MPATLVPEDSEPALAALTKVVEALDWSDPLAWRGARARYAVRAWAALERFRVRVRDTAPTAADRLDAALAATDTDAAERVLTAPVVINLLLWGPATSHDADNLAGFLRREQFPVSPSGHVEAGWTATGSALVTPGGAPDELWLTADRHDDEDLTRLRSPRVGVNGPVLDVRSPLAGIGDKGLGQYEPLARSVTEAEACASLRLLRSAMQTLDEVVPAASSFVRDWTKVITLKTVQHPALCSGSYLRFPGRTQLVNVHSEQTHVRIIDALVHEAIHHHLSAIQLDGEMLGPTIRRSSGTSPWSSRKLPARIFVEACFVWYGLFRLWSAVASSTHESAAGDRLTEALPYGKVVRWASHCAKGFLSGTLRGQLTSLGVDARLIEAVGRMESEILRRADPGLGVRHVG